MGWIIVLDYFEIEETRGQLFGAVKTIPKIYLELVKKYGDNYSKLFIPKRL